MNDKTLENLKARGISYEVQESPVLDSEGRQVKDRNGNPLVRSNIVITGIPPLEEQVNKFYSPFSPCWFPECEGLRAEYNAEVEAHGDQGCAGCQKGAIMRKYEARVRDAIQRHKQHESNPDTRTEQVPRPDATSRVGTPTKQSVLRRTADRVAQILGYRPR